MSVEAVKSAKQGLTSNVRLWNQPMSLCHTESDADNQAERLAGLKLMLRSKTVKQYNCQVGEVSCQAKRPESTRNLGVAVELRRVRKIVWGPEVAMAPVARIQAAAALNG